MAFSIDALKPLIGSNVRTDRATLLSGAHALAIRELLDRRGVLTFRDIFLDDSDQLAFAATLGDVIARTNRKPDKIALDQSETAAYELLLATSCWHFDGAVEEEPPGISMLGARRLSDTGGRTEFCNLYAAYESLSDEDKRRIAPLRVIHDREFHHRSLHPDPTEEQLRQWRLFPPRSHPLVWTHRSGRKSLMLGATASQVEGLGPRESRALIERLQAWATEPRFVYSHEWRLGDLVLWNNHGVLHRVTPFPLESRRLLFRASLEGHEVPS
jgi:alpha-ketoglutarate-dependent taurine dioxygenase